MSQSERTRGGRILVVDDGRDWRSMVAGLLSDAGYDVSMAEDEASAMRLLRERPYHVAILDLRLDEPDERNREGLTVARRMKEHQPELSVIFLTGHADLESAKAAHKPRPDGSRLAYDFLEKHEITKLLQSIEMAFTNDARVNPTLQIDFDPALDLQGLQDDIECLRSLDLVDAQLEIIDLLQRIFYQADRVCVKPLKNGHSGGSVMLVTPINHGIAQDEVVVKLNNRTRAEQESRNYDQYVANYLGKARRTQRRDYRATARLGGIAYSFIGAGSTEFRRFRDVYATADTTQLVHILDNLFLETCHTWYTNTVMPLENREALGPCYMQWLALHNHKLESALFDLVDRHDDGPIQFVEPFRPYQSPLRFAGSHVQLTAPLAGSYSPFPYEGAFCFTHGDLHEDNILIDGYQQTWLIDFYATGRAHPVRDFALLECAIKFYLQQSPCSLDELYDWESSLVHTSDLTDRPSLGDQTDESLRKATDLIGHVRSLLHSVLPAMTIRDYWISLYFHALKGMTLGNKFTERQRLHALFSASLLADALGLGSDT